MFIASIVHSKYIKYHAGFKVHHINYWLIFLVSVVLFQGSDGLKKRHDIYIILVLGPQIDVWKRLEEKRATSMFYAILAMYWIAPYVWSKFVAYITPAQQQNI